jgi:hypothetical protein
VLLKVLLPIRCASVETDLHYIGRDRGDIYTLMAYKARVEFIEAQYRAVQEELGTNPELGDLMPGTGAFERCARRMRGAVRVAEVVANYLLLLQVGSSDMADDGF